MTERINIRNDKLTDKYLKTLEEAGGKNKTEIIKELIWNAYYWYTQPEKEPKNIVGLEGYHTGHNHAISIMLKGIGITERKEEKTLESK